MARLTFPTLSEAQARTSRMAGGSSVSVDDYTTLTDKADGLTVDLNDAPYNVQIDYSLFGTGSRTLRVSTFDYSTSTTATRLPEPIVARVNRLLLSEGIRAERNWRTKGHDLRWGQGLRQPMAGGSVWTLTDSGAGWAAPGGKPAAAVIPAGIVISPAPATSAAPSVIVHPPHAPAKPAPAKRAASAPVGTAASLRHSDMIITRSMREAWAEVRGMTKIGTPTALFLTGPTGTGKTSTVTVLAEAEGLSVTKVNADGVVEPAEWFGSMQHVAGEGDGHYEFRPSAFWRALTSPEPSVVVIDEINRATISATNALLGILDYEGTVTVPQTGEAEVVNPAVQIVATANVGSEYAVGTQPLDPALDNRLEYREAFDYLSEADETRVLLARFGPHGLSEHHARTVAQAAALIRQSAKSGLHAPLSTRLALRLGAAIAVGADPVRAAERAILRHYSPEGGGSSEQAKVRTILSGMTWKPAQP